MIKVIASDMDGTLLGEDHRIAPETLEAVKDACDAGIRFIITTGREFKGAMQQLEGTGIVCDYIVSSGAEVRNPRKEIVALHPMNREMCRRVYGEIKEYPISAVFCTSGCNYFVGTPEEGEESLIRQIQLFHMNMCRDEVTKTDLYREMKERSDVIPSLEELEKTEVPVYKIFLFTGDLEMLDQIRRSQEKNPDIAGSSSFMTNLEITDIKAQKGPVLKEYIESLGYTMDEVMAIGDSLNDLSMLSMDFGATVAMGNADWKIKRAAKYVTRSNTEQGVAWAIQELLKRQN